MKVLRLKLYQETACYKKPFAFKVGETYPLPPYSTVKGMVHSLLDATEFIPMKISIQGIYDSKMLDYQSHYLVKSDKSDEFPLVLDGLQTEYMYQHITQMPLYMHMLYDVHLLIHIQAETDILEQIEKVVKNTTHPFSLGRWEDLLSIQECEIVDIHEEEEAKNLEYHAYIPEQYSEYFEGYGVRYLLNWKYQIKNNVRVWEKVPVQYLLKGTTMTPDVGEFLLIDTKGDMVFFPK